MMFKDECKETTVDPIITKSENGRTIRLQNPTRKEITIVYVDGCQIVKGKRCDLLFISENVAFFVELKGTDINHAFEQIKASIRTLSKAVDKKAISSFIICTRVPPATSTSIQRMKKELKKTFKSEMKIKNRELSIAV